MKNTNLTMQFFSHHLSEIRLRCFYIAFSFSFTFFVCYMFQREILFFTGRPFLEFHAKFIFIDLTEAFYTILQICMIGSILGWIPYLVYQIWSFWIPSCYFHERIWIRGILFAAGFFLLLEIYFIYWYILPKICAFLLSFEMKPSPFDHNDSCHKSLICDNVEIFSLVELSLRIGSYMGLMFKISSLLLLLFQIPFLVYILYKYEWLDSFTLSENRKPLLFCCVLFCALVAPPDVLSQCMITSVLYCLFEGINFLGFVHFSKG